MRHRPPLTGPGSVPPAAYLPLLTTTASVPANYAETLSMWRTATTAYAQRRFATAADTFVAVAERLKSNEEIHRATFAAGRCLSYKNAAKSWERAGKPEVAKARLAPIAQSDPACRHTIRKALEKAAVRR